MVCCAEGNIGETSDRSHATALTNENDRHPKKDQNTFRAPDEYLKLEGPSQDSLESFPQRYLAESVVQAT